MSNFRPKGVELEFGAGFGCVTSRADCLYIGNAAVGLIRLGDMLPARTMALLTLHIDQGAGFGDVLKTARVEACGVTGQAASIQFGRLSSQRVDCSCMRRVGPRHIFRTVAVQTCLG